MTGFTKTQNNRQNYTFVYRNLRVFEEQSGGRKTNGLKMFKYPHNLKLSI